MVSINAINEFAIKHKIRWGREKCKVMRVGKHTKEEYKWTIGEMEIDETDHYKYLGDIVSSDGRNKENIKSRQTMKLWQELKHQSCLTFMGL